MNEEPELVAYIARKPCGCFVYAGVGDNTAKEIAWAIKQGYTIDRVGARYVREHWRSSCAVCKPVQAVQESFV